jgi:hypothetical protein
VAIPSAIETARALLRLTHVGDPVGWENQEHVERAVAGAGMIVCAWGAHGDNFQADTVRGWMIGKEHYALGFTKDGHPRHPLYLRNDATPHHLESSGRKLPYRQGCAIQGTYADQHGLSDRA